MRQKMVVLTGPESVIGPLENYDQELYFIWLTLGRTVMFFVYFCFLKTGEHR